MKIASRDIPSLLSKPDPKYHAYLLYGYDEGLVRERAKKIALHFTDQLDDPFLFLISPVRMWQQIKRACLTA